MRAASPALRPWDSAASRHWSVTLANDHSFAASVDTTLLTLPAKDDACRGTAAADPAL